MHACVRAWREDSKGSMDGGGVSHHGLSQGGRSGPAAAHCRRRLVVKLGSRRAAAGRQGVREGHVDGAWGDPKEEWAVGERTEVESRTRRLKTRHRVQAAAMHEKVAAKGSGDYVRSKWQMANCMMRKTKKGI